MKPIRILSLPVDDGGCGWMRVRQPFEMINAHTESEAQVTIATQDPVAVAKAFAMAQVAVVRQGGELGMRTMRTIPEFQHLKWVLDIDDNVELISPYSEHYKQYGLEEFYDQGSKQWVWKNGVGGFELSGNRTRVLSLIKGMQEADMVTATTETLAEYARQYSKNVVVLPNAVDPSKWYPLPFVPNKRLRVGWSGGISHYEDWYSIREPLNKLLRDYDFTLVVVGSHFDGLIDKELRHRVEIAPWVPFPAHSWHMMCQNLDIAIIPLADLPFNRYKSPLKLVEMSALGIPSVVSGITPYVEECDVDRACPYTGPAGFYDALKSLLDSPAKRRRIGAAAREWAVTHYDARTLAPRWVEAYSSLLTRS